MSLDWVLATVNSTSGEAPWACAFVGPPLGSWVLGSRFAASCGWATLPPDGRGRAHVCSVPSSGRRGQAHAHPLVEQTWTHGM